MTTIQNMICFTPNAIKLSAYFYAASFFIMGVLLGIVIMKIRNKKRIKKNG